MKRLRLVSFQSLHFALFALLLRVSRGICKKIELQNSHKLLTSVFILMGSVQVLSACARPVNDSQSF